MSGTTDGLAFLVRYVDRIWRLIEDDVRETVLHESA